MGRCLPHYELFEDDEDREFFTSLLQLYLSETASLCYGWVLMSNHYHLVIRLSDHELWELMKPLNMRFSQYHSKKYSRKGPLFQDRFKSIATQDQKYLEELIRYVHLNPLRAGIVKSIAALNKYPWSGHQEIIGIIFQSAKN